MENSKANERRNQIRRSQKVYGVPILPQKIDAMYENMCRGNLTAYYLDPDPVRDDPIYLKLEKLQDTYGFDPNGSERVAKHLQNDMISRQMKEKTYRHIEKLPLWFLRLEFAVKHETNRALRGEINRRFRYMFIENEKEWLD